MCDTLENHKNVVEIWKKLLFFPAEVERGGIGGGSETLEHHWRNLRAGLIFQFRPPTYHPLAKQKYLYPRHARNVMYKLLVIEDEVKMADSIRQGLEENEYWVDVAYDGSKGLEMALEKAYDVIISDRILPLKSGLELCKELRRQHVAVPILLLTALGSTDDKVDGLDAGADDYLAKPFEFKELLARIRALLKRGVHFNTYRVLRVGDLELGIESKVVTRGGKEIELTPTEFGLLEFLMKNKGRVMSKADIADRVWGITYETGTNVVEVYVNYLRKKIDRDFETKLIHTYKGMGYVIK
jgi:two-component system, OmpR family, copper resistance phosphate regulon response regulator CusR